MRRIVLAGLVGTFAVVAGCRDDSPSEPNAESHVGTYTLVTVNGDPLPFIVAQIGNDKIEILDGFATLNADETYSESGTIRVTQDGSATTETETSAGTYTRNGSAIVFTEPAGATTNGSLSGSDLTVIDSDVTLVYRK